MIPSDDDPFSYVPDEDIGCDLVVVVGWLTIALVLVFALAVMLFL